MKKINLLWYNIPQLTQFDNQALDLNPCYKMRQAAIMLCIDFNNRSGKYSLLVLKTKIQKKALEYSITEEMREQVRMAGANINLDVTRNSYSDSLLNQLKAEGIITEGINPHWTK